MMQGYRVVTILIGIYLGNIYVRDCIYLHISCDYLTIEFTPRAANTVIAMNLDQHEKGLPDK